MRRPTLDGTDTVLSYNTGGRRPTRVDIIFEGTDQDLEAEDVEQVQLTRVSTPQGIDTVETVTLMSDIAEITSQQTLPLEGRVVTDLVDTDHENETTTTPPSMETGSDGYEHSLLDDDGLAGEVFTDEPMPAVDVAQAASYLAGQCTQQVFATVIASDQQH
jgi:hypothetical protein